MWHSQCLSGSVCLPRGIGEKIPGCVGIDISLTDADFCVARDQGYTLDLGGTPAASIFPLRACEGDCDLNSDVSASKKLQLLICFNIFIFKIFA